MSDLLIQYADDLRTRRLAPTTIRVRLVVAGIIDDRYDPLTATPDDLREIVARSWSRLSLQTHSSYIQHTRDFFAWLQRTGRRDDDPSVGLTRPRVPRHLPHPISEDDLQRALAAADPLMTAWLVLAAYAGLRCCEIAGFTTGDVLDGAVRVRGKGGKERVIPVGSETLRAIRRAGLPRAGLAWRNQLGHPFTAQRVSERIAGHLRGLGIDATAHCLRHRYATRMLALSHDIQLVRTLLGHESVATTQIYAAYDQRGAALAIAALDAMLAA